jgi:hypothetical protein
MSEKKQPQKRLKLSGEKRWDILVSCMTALFEEAGKAIMRKYSEIATELFVASLNEKDVAFISLAHRKDMFPAVEHIEPPQQRGINPNYDPKSHDNKEHLIEHILVLDFKWTPEDYVKYQRDRKNGYHLHHEFVDSTSRPNSNNNIPLTRRVIVPFDVYASKDGDELIYDVGLHDDVIARLQDLRAEAVEFEDRFKKTFETMQSFVWSFSYFDEFEKNFPELVDCVPEYIKKAPELVALPAPVVPNELRELIASNLKTAA